MKNRIASLASLSLAVARSTDAPTTPAELGRSESAALAEVVVPAGEVYKVNPLLTTA
jgi:hypothetical protein